MNFQVAVFAAQSHTPASVILCLQIIFIASISRKHRAVRAGSLNHPSKYKPQADIFTSRAPAWDGMDSALPKFLEMPT